jgi:hypothetical protein
MRFIAGVDPGQAHDPTGLALVERIVTRAPAPEGEPRSREPVRGWNPAAHTMTRPGPSPLAAGYDGRPLPQPEPLPDYHVRHLERLPLQTPYPAVVSHVAALLATSPVAGDSVLVLDRTGIGRAVFDLFAARGLKPIGITIHGGDAVTADAGGFHVPKRDLIAAVLVTLQQGRLRFAKRLPLVAELQRELLNFRVTISPAGHDSYNARDGEFDDILLALAVAIYYGERWRPPPPPRHGIGTRSFVTGWQPPLFPSSGR